MIEQDSVKLEINDNESYLEISREFNEENLQKFEAMLRDILFNQKVKEVKMTIRTDAIDHDMGGFYTTSLPLFLFLKLPIHFRKSH